MIDLLIEDCATVWMNMWKASVVTVTFCNPVMSLAMLDAMLEDEEDEDDDSSWYEVTVWDWLH